MNFVGTTAGGMAVGLAIIATCAVISRFNPFYRRELAADAGRRELSLDGLRGIAALMVVMHHAAMFRNSLRTGEWGNTGSPVLLACGPGGVHLFFMLTAFLFWSKARAAAGKLKIAKLWRGRVYRIGPLYFFSVALIMTIAIGTGKVRVGAGLLKSAGKLLGMGLIPWGQIGGFKIGDINAGVVWTLWYEWGFYLALPFIAWFAMGRRVFWLAAATYAAAFCAQFWLGISTQPALVFMLGMLCPVLLDNEPLRVQLRSPVAAVIAFAAMLLLAISNPAPLLSFRFAFSMFPIFLVAAAGNNFGGLLVQPALRCLGAISYSLYLLHGIVFYVLINLLKAAGHAALPEISYWAIAATTAIALSAFCAATYRWIEFPFLSQSHKIPMAARNAATTPAVAPSAL